nr:tetratricopeptide repeat protein [Saprospiraceae bacterium]
MEDWSGALVDFTAAIVLDSAYTESYFSRGFVHWKMDEYEHAVENFQRGLDLDPAHPAHEEAILACGLSFLELDDTNKACEIFHQLYRLNAELARDLLAEICE